MLHTMGAERRRQASQTPLRPPRFRVGACETTSRAFKQRIQSHKHVAVSSYNNWERAGLLSYDSTFLSASEQNIRFLSVDRIQNAPPQEMSKPEWVSCVVHITANRTAMWLAVWLAVMCTTQLDRLEAQLKEDGFSLSWLLERYNISNIHEIEDVSL